MTRPGRRAATVLSSCAPTRPTEGLTMNARTRSACRVRRLAPVALLAAAAVVAGSLVVTARELSDAPAQARSTTVKSGTTYSPASRGSSWALVVRLAARGSSWS